MKNRRTPSPFALPCEYLTSTLKLAVGNDILRLFRQSNQRMRAKLTHTRRLSPPPSQHISYSPHFTTPRNNKVVRNPAHTRRLPPPSQQMLKAVNAGIKLTYTPEEQGLFDKIIAESVAMSKSEKLRSSSSGGRRRQPRISKLRAESEQKEKTDLIRMYEECKLAGAVVEVGPASEDRRQGVKFVEDGRKNNSGSVDVIRGSPVLSSTSVASSPLEQRIAAMRMIRARHHEERWAPNNAVDLCDRPQPDDPAGEGGGAGERSGEGAGEGERLPAGWKKHWSKTHNRPYYFNKAKKKQSFDLPGSPSGEGEMENTRLSIVALQDDCCGHTPRPRSFVPVVLDRSKKEERLFGWLRGAYHRASMLILRKCARA